jgi:hypothetical protein
MIHMTMGIDQAVKRVFGPIANGFNHPIRTLQVTRIEDHKAFVSLKQNGMGKGFHHGHVVCQFGELKVDAIEWTYLVGTYFAVDHVSTEF